MRVVEYEKSTTAVAYRWMNAVAIASSALAAIILLLIVSNHLLLKRTDPIHAPALLKLTEQLKSDPQNAQLHEQIRELDLLARHAFFSSQRFQAISIYLLIGALTVAVISFKALQTYRARAPYPAHNPPKEDLAQNAKWARTAMTATGLVLIGIALSLALPWSSPLDEPKVSSPPAKAIAARPTAQDFAKNWPRFLGASGGRAASANLPIAWSETNGVQWKVNLPRPGLNSPIVWENRIFLTGGDAEAREVYCFDAEEGKLLWTHSAAGIEGSPTKLPKVSDDATMAASSMATDGERVFAIFATGDLLALDFQGKRIWARNLGTPDNPYGHGSSLAVFEDLLLVQYDQRTNGVVLAIDAKTGDTRWKTPRAFQPSWATPTVADIGGKTQLLLAAAPALASYDLKTGSELWRVAYFGHAEVASSPVFSDGLVFVSAEEGGLGAIDPKTRALVWNDKETAPGVPTPLVVGEWLFYGWDETGIVCRNARTGQKLWETETDNAFYASPILSGDRIYLIDRAGATHIFRASDKFELIGKCKLEAEDAATPAIHGNSLYIRDRKHLYRIGS